MKVKTIMVRIGIMVLAILLNVLVISFQPKVDDEWVTVEITVEGDQSFQTTLYYLTSQQNLSDDFSVDKSLQATYTDVGKKQTLSFAIPAITEYIRFDPCENGEKVFVDTVQLVYRDKVINDIGTEFTTEDAISIHDEKHMEQKNGVLQVYSGSSDPNLVWKISLKTLLSHIKDALSVKHGIIKMFVCLIMDSLFLVIWKKRKALTEIPKEIVHDRKLIFSLAKNDFKTKFAGSYFGIIWAFVQPIVTVVVYWFVFEKALNAGTQTTKAGINVPFVLWLIAGLVPWFFFSEVLSVGTNALIEYSYLVKKVVFKISILPIVKIVSTLFVHLFFIAFTLVLYSCYQYYPTIYMLQIAYYSFCMIMLSMGIIYATSAMVIFFRDLSQVINIILQVGIWVTPIMWNMDAMIGKVSPALLGILKLNPMFYVVSGYRDSLINHIWFWDRPEITMYFWLVVSVIFCVGFGIFRRLQVHFADVL